MFVSKATIMENQNSSITPHAMSYGLYMGLALVVNSALFYVMGQPFSPTTGLVSNIILIAGIVWSMRVYRSNHPDEGFPYGRALGLGTLQSLFASLIMAFYTYVLFVLVDPTLMDKLFTSLEAQLLGGKVGENQVETIITMYRKLLTPLSYAFGIAFSMTFYGFIFSLIIAIFYKKKPTDPFYGVE